MRELTITIPDQVDEDKIKMLIAASLYENDLLNSEQAAELAGISRRKFLEEVGKYQVSIFGEKEEDLESLGSLEI
jgi:predicted HTH domain antitoxin